MPRRRLLTAALVAGYVALEVTAFVPVTTVPAGTKAQVPRRQTTVVLQSSKFAGPPPEDDKKDLPDVYTEIDGIVFEGDFEDDSVRSSLTSLLEDVADDGSDAFKLDDDDSLFAMPDLIPSELPDLAAIGTGLESNKQLTAEFLDGDFDPNDQKMYKLLGLDTLDEKKTKVDPDDFKLPGRFLRWQGMQEAQAKYRRHDADTGSSAVQIAQLTLQVNQLTEHARRNPKDHASRRGLMRAVNQRRRLLNYMSKKNRPKAEALAAELGIRYRAPDTYRSKFEMYRYFKNTKSKVAKNMQLVKGEEAVGV